MSVLQGFVGRTNNGLLGHSRVWPSARADATDVTLLLFMGAVSALVTSFVDLGLGIPGHAVVRSVLPMALGLALAPRRHAGLVMGTGAFGTIAALRVFGVGAGIGAVTSLLMIGPCLDLALRQARKGWQIYAGLALAGLAANLVAFGVRAFPKLLDFEVGIRNFATWWPRAVVTYPMSGLVAGALSAAIWFSLARRSGGASS